MTERTINTTTQQDGRELVMHDGKLCWRTVEQVPSVDWVGRVKEFYKSHKKRVLALGAVAVVAAIPFIQNELHDWANGEQIDGTFYTPQYGLAPDELLHNFFAAKETIADNTSNPLEATSFVIDLLTMGVK